MTQVGGKWRGSAKLRHGPAPAHPARSGRCRCYGLRLAGRHAHLDQGGSSEALGPTDGAGSKKQGLGQTRRSSGQSERQVMIACEAVNGEWRGGRGAVAEMTVCCEIGISVKFKIFKSSRITTISF